MLLRNSFVGSTIADLGAFARGYGSVDWQWSAANRARVEARHGSHRESEVVLSYYCHEPPSLFCKNSTLHYASNGSLAFAVSGEDAPNRTVAFLHTLAHVPWLRIETTHMNDFKWEGQIREVCVASGMLFPGFGLHEVGEPPALPPSGQCAAPMSLPVCLPSPLCLHIRIASHAYASLHLLLRIASPSYASPSGYPCAFMRLASAAPVRAARLGTGRLSGSNNQPWVVADYSSSPS